MGVSQRSTEGRAERGFRLSHQTGYPIMSITIINGTSRNFEFPFPGREPANYI